MLFAGNLDDFIALDEVICATNLDAPKIVDNLQLILLLHHVLLRIEVDLQKLQLFELQVNFLVIVSFWLPHNLNLLLGPIKADIPHLLLVADSCGRLRYHIG